jgi:protein-disulfide isomerase
MNEDRTDHTRRGLLSLVAGTAVLAGCVGGGDDNETENGNDNTSDDNETSNGDEPSDGNDNETENGDEPSDGTDNETGDTDDGTGDESDDGGPETEVPVLGDPDAAVTLEVYEDFNCPHCRRYNEEAFPELRTEYIDPGRIRYEHWTLPVVDENSWEAASAAREVFETYGNDEFWEYGDRLFDRQGEIGATEGLYGDIADEMGLDGDRVQSAAEERIHDDRIETNRARARDRGVRATPSFVVNGELVTLERGERRAEAVGDALDAALADAEAENTDSESDDTTGGY